MALCYCKTCKKTFHHLGIMRHKAMHRDNKEDCEIEFSDGSIRIYKFSKINSSDRSKDIKVRGE